MIVNKLDDQAIFEVARKISSGKARQAYLAQVWGDDPAMAQRIEALLQAHDESGSFLECPPPGISSPLTISQAAPERIGTQIGPYKLLEQIGEGGMGVVYVAEQSEPIRRRVALKIIKPGMDSRQVIVRFEAERQTLAIMDHPNIAKVLDAGTTEAGLPYFVMELVKGTPITEFCDAQKLTTRERLKLFAALCQAVQHAHQKGIIHRDIKPSNVLVEVHDVVPVPKVIDFGVAKAMGQQLSERTLHTGFAQMIGTPLYMSPEQAGQSSIDIDTRSDIYSLGVLLYQLLTGTTPFDKETLTKAGYDEMRRMIREVDLPLPSARISTLQAQALSTVSDSRKIEPRKLSQQLRGELDWIVMKALEKDRSRRYESASAFAADVQRYLNDDPVLACPPSASYRFRKSARRNKAALTTTALVAVALVIGAGGSVWQALRATQAEQNAVDAWEQESQRRQQIEQQSNRAKAAEQLAKSNEQRAREEKSKAEESQADTLAFSEFLVDDVLAVARPEGVQGGLGVDVTVARALEAAEVKLAERFAGRPLAEAAVCDAIGKTWRNLAKYEQAERHLRRAVELRERLLAPNDPATLSSRNSLGILLSDMERHKEAISILEEILETRKVTLGPDHRDTLHVMSSLGLAYSEAGQVEQGLTQLEQALEGQRAQLGPDHPDTFRTINNLAVAYLRAGELERALPLLEEALKTSRENFGTDHPTTLVIMTNIARAFSDSGDPQRALPLLEETLTWQKVKHGDAHPRTLATMKNLGDVYAILGRPADAESIFLEALAGARRQLSPDHPALHNCLHVLARFYWKMGRPKESVPLWEEVLRCRKENLGEDDPLTVNTAFNLAVNYRSAGQWREAVEVIDEWLPHACSARSHTDTHWRIEEAASIYVQSDQLVKAEPLLRELVELSKQEAGAESPQCAAAIARLGLNLLYQKKYTEAEPLLLSGYEGIKQREGKISPVDEIRLTEAIQRLVQLYEAWGELEKAEPWRMLLPTGQPIVPVKSGQD